MLDPSLAFSLAGLLALLAWLGLAAALFVPALRTFVFPAAGLAVPAAIAVAYALLIPSGLDAPGGGFESIAQVRALFMNDAALAAGWLHYLAFDLFVGTWIAREGLAVGVPRLLLLLCLLLTFLFGPVGFLLFLLLRFGFARRERQK
jgi:hypothetical protein